MSTAHAYRIHGKGAEEMQEIVYKCERLCGQGNFSSVFQAQLLQPEQRVIAIKNIWNTRKYSRSANEEISILKEMQHENIISLLYYFSKQVDNDWIVSLVLEYLPETMMISRNKRNFVFSPFQIKLYSWQMFSALEYIHAKSIIHLDIKPSNIVIDHKLGLIKLTDFGNSVKIDPMKPPMNCYQVTRFYRPPELLFGSISFTCAIDLWSLGCVIYEMTSNRTLFKGKSSIEQMELILDVFGYPTAQDVVNMKISRPRAPKRDARGLQLYIAQTIPEDMIAFLSNFLQIDPTKRLSAHEALTLSFFDELIQNIENYEITMPDFVRKKLAK
ncbi:unnamed protein product [Auanema sp. JU1783]|nr:unnamed protein product [Auanema sp. JU1783]